jgi:hypothetical protein
LQTNPLLRLSAENLSERIQSMFQVGMERLTWPMLGEREFLDGQHSMICLAKLVSNSNFAVGDFNFKVYL